MEVGAYEEVVLGQFSHRSDELRFQWVSTAPSQSKPRSLQYVPLEVKIGSSRQICQLWKPIISNSISVGSRGTKNAEVPIPKDLIDNQEMLRVGYQLIGTDRPERPSAMSILGKSAQISLGNALQVEMDLTLVASPTGSRLQVRLFGMPPSLAKNRQSKEIRKEISADVVADHLRQANARDPKKKK